MTHIWTASLEVPNGTSNFTDPIWTSRMEPKPRRVYPQVNGTSPAPLNRPLTMVDDSSTAAGPPHKQRKVSNLNCRDSVGATVQLMKDRRVWTPPPKDPPEDGSNGNVLDPPTYTQRSIGSPSKLRSSQVTIQMDRQSLVGNMPAIVQPAHDSMMVIDRKAKEVPPAAQRHIPPEETPQASNESTTNPDCNRTEALRHSQPIPAQEPAQAKGPTPPEKIPTQNIADTTTHIRMQMLEEENRKLRADNAKFPAIIGELSDDYHQLAVQSEKVDKEVRKVLVDRIEEQSQEIERGRKISQFWLGLERLRHEKINQFFEGTLPDDDVVFQIASTGILSDGPDARPELGGDGELRGVKRGADQLSE